MMVDILGWCGTTAMISCLVIASRNRTGTSHIT
jgi:hypothetical protein